MEQWQTGAEQCIYHGHSIAYRVHVNSPSPSEVCTAATYFSLATLVKFAVAFSPYFQGNVTVHKGYIIIN